MSRPKSRKTRFITIQILPDDARQAWTFKFRYRFFEFLFYSVFIALFATGIAALKITEINAKVLTAEHLADQNRELLDKQKKMALLEQELGRILERERKIRDLLQTLVVKRGPGHPREEAVGALTPAYLQAFAGRVPFPLQGRAEIPFGLPAPGFLQAVPGDSLNSPALDIFTEAEMPVSATAAGKVVEADWSRRRGHFVRLDHGGGFETVYGRLEQALVQTGDFVERGRLVGIAGRDAESPAPVLRYEVRLHGKPFPPDPRRSGSLKP